LKPPIAKKITIEKKAQNELKTFSKTQKAKKIVDF
jgi:hypothetical protein